MNAPLLLDPQYSNSHAVQLGLEPTRGPQEHSCAGWSNWDASVTTALAKAHKNLGLNLNHPESDQPAVFWLQSC